ncbi:HAMP domain-containing protein [Candidatus Peregrinibacteria bacterium]|nr:HAMP domain-containing protein [Candidatus Peregrinibacteria bacterium]
MRQKFRTKFIILLLLVSLIPTIFIGIMSYEISKTALYDRIITDLNTQASHVLDQIDRFLYESYKDTQLLISDTTLIDPKTSTAQKETVLKEYLINLGLYDNLYLLDLEGNIIASTNINAKRAEIKNAQWFINTKKLFFNASDALVSPFTGKPTILFSNLILDENNEPTGIIVAELTWAVVLDFLDNVPRDTEAILLNDNYIQIGGTEDETFFEKEWGLKLAEQLNNEIYLTSFVNSQGYLVYKGNNWKLFLRMPVDIALAPLQRLFKLIGLILIGTILATGLTGLIFGDRFVSPIQKLIIGAEAIQKGNLNQKIKVKSKDEIGYLARAFNEMSSSLKEKQQKLKRALKKQKQLEKTKDAIWSTASHKLRTPLTGMRWSIELLCSNNLGNLNKEQIDTVNQIYKSTLRLNFLVDLLLNATRLEEGKMKLNKEKFYLEEVIEKSIDKQKIEIIEKNIKLQKPEKKKETIKVNLDKNRIQQVFDSIIENAIVYNQEKGGITIDLNKKGKKVICEIADTGVGIPDEDKGIVYLKFHRGKNSAKYYTEGVGLGLYLAKYIIESSKGKIWFESKINEGTKFYIELPLA